MRINGRQKANSTLLCAAFFAEVTILSLMSFPISAAAAAVCWQGIKGLQHSPLPPGHTLVGNRADYWLIGNMGSNVSMWSPTTEKESDSSKLQCVIEVEWFWVPEDGREKKREKRDLLNSDKWNKILQILPIFFLASSVPHLSDAPSFLP